MNNDFNNILKDVKKSFIIINIMYLLFFILGFLISYGGNDSYKGQIFNQQNIKALSNKYLF